MTPVKRTRALARLMHAVSPQWWTALALVVLVVAVFAQSYEGRAALVRSQRAGCERGKLDRTANAAAWSAQRAYITHVLAAASVKQDVKRAATVAVVTFNATSGDLTRRARIDCRKVFPSATPWPG